MSCRGLDESGLFAGGEGLSRNEQFYAAAFTVADFVVVNIAGFEILVLGHEIFDIDVELVLADHRKCGPDARRNHQNHHDSYPCFRPLCLHLVRNLDFMEVQVLDHQICGQDDEDAVYEEQIQCTEEYEQASRGHAVACSTERRHQCGSDRDAGNDRSLFLAAHLENACQTAEQCYYHIVDCRVGPGHQLSRIGKFQWGEQEIQ